MPQLSGSVVVSMQRSVQTWSPVGQVMPQTPAVHVALPVHGVEQPPHAKLDEYKLRQREPHRVAGGSQAATHPEAEHRGLAVSQVTLQLPHVAGLERSASQPLAGFPSQSAQPASHDAMAHASA